MLFIIVGTLLLIGLILIINLISLKEKIKDLEEDIKHMKHNHTELQNHICYKKGIKHGKSN